MSTKGVIDLVFCLDASASMRPCIDAVRRRLEFTAPDGKAYRLAPSSSTLVIRPPPSNAGTV